MNKFGGYRYRSCEDILEALKPLLAKHECTITISDEVIEVGGRIYVKATAKIIKSGSGEENFDDSASVCGWAREAETRKGMDDSQITGSASSYARKYALNGLFAIDDTKDADATNDHGKDSSKDNGLVDRAVKAIQTSKDKAGLDKVLDHCKAKGILEDPAIQKAIKSK